MVPQRINEMQKLMPVLTLRAIEVLKKLCFYSGSISLAVFLHRGIWWNNLVHLKKQNDLLFHLLIQCCFGGCKTNDSNSHVHI